MNANNYPRSTISNDVALFLDKAPHVKLVEINPFHILTQACLFSWHTSGFDGGFRFAHPESKPEPFMDFFLYSNETLASIINSFC
jgi:hypothetical protein